MEGFSLDQAEAALHRMAAAFGGDPAATDAARVLRLPGFHNKKFAEPIAVLGHRLHDTSHWRQDFAHVQTSPTMERPGAGKPTGFRRDGHPLSQSERDWAWVRDQLRAGAAPEAVQQELAMRRKDKHRPADYAERTIRRAQAIQVR